MTNLGASGNLSSPQFLVVTDGVHLVCRDLVTLHNFASRMGLKRAWFQGGGQRHPHYDLTTPKAVARAIAQGARRVTAREALLEALLASGAKGGAVEVLKCQ